MSQSDPTPNLTAEEEAMPGNKADEPRCCYCGTLNPEKLRMRDEGQRLTIDHLLKRQEMLVAELRQLKAEEQAGG